jgi:uncharacterized protein (DUF1330 family)
MAAYFVVDIDVHDPAGMSEYRARVPSTVQKYGGKYLVRGGKWECLEGDWKPRGVVVLEFPSVEQAKRWYESEEYRDLKAARRRASTANIILVEGVESK